MLLKAGVDISRLKREIRRALPKLDRIYRGLGEHLVITSTYEGTHSPGSLHYANDAVDTRLPAREVKGTMAEIRRELGPDYDVVKEVNHIHIEWDPKG